MFLSIYVYRHLGLTLDLTEERLPFPRDAMQEGPAFTRLTAEPGNLRDPVRLGHWLDAFLPENGAVAPYRQHARQAWEQHGAGVDRATAASILWGNADAEYTGAIDFRRTDRHPPERLPEHGPPDLEPLSEAAIGARLELASRIADSAPRTRPAELLALSGRRSSLSGMRGKLSLTPLADGRWGVARGDGLNTWICKHEQRLNLPGEVGVEAVCQRALTLARIPAAAILARVFDGRQAVLSRRTDRTVAPDGRVTARHQEEWVQAEGHPPDDKYHGGRRDEPQWPDAYRLLRQRGTRPDHAQGSLSRALVAAWLLAHSDLHRRNLGFLHAPDDAPAGIEPAPLYDVSSAVGTKYAKQLAIPVHDALDVHRIGPVQWIRHSERGGAAPDVTLAAIEELLRTLPDAVATARAHSRTRDELLEPGAAAERTAQVIQHIQARGRAWRNEANRMAKRNTPGFEPDTQRLADTLRAAADPDPGGSVTCTADAAGNALHMAWTPRPTASRLPSARRHPRGRPPPSLRGPGLPTPKTSRSSSGRSKPSANSRARPTDSFPATHVTGRPSFARSAVPCREARYASTPPGIVSTRLPIAGSRLVLQLGRLAVPAAQLRHRARATEAHRLCHTGATDAGQGRHPRNAAEAAVARRQARASPP